MTWRGEDDQILETIEVSGSCEGSEPNLGSHSFTNMVKSYLGPHSWKHSCWLMPLWGLQRSHADTDSAGNPIQPGFIRLRTNPGGRLLRVLKCIPFHSSSPGFWSLFQLSQDAFRLRVLRVLPEVERFRGSDPTFCCEESGGGSTAWLTLAFGSFVDTQTWSWYYTRRWGRRKNWTFSIHNLFPRDF